MNTETKAPSTIIERNTTLRFVRWLCGPRTLLKAGFVLLWVAAAIALFYGIENWRGARAWNQLQREIASRGESLDFEAYYPKPIPDEQNFAANAFVKEWFERPPGKEASKRWEDLYTKASSKLKKPKRTDPRRPLTDLPAWAQALAAVQAGDAQEEIASETLNRESRAKAAATVAATLATNLTWLPELRTYAARPKCVYPVQFDLEVPAGILLPHLANIRAICDRAQLKAAAELAMGNTDAALKDLGFIFYMAETLKSEPIIISQLVRLRCLQSIVQVVWEGLAEQRWTPEQLQEFQLRFEQMNLLADLTPALLAERAANVKNIDYLRKHGDVGLLDSDAEPGSPGNWVAKLMPSGWYRKEQVSYCRLQELLVAGGFDAAQRRVHPQKLEENNRQFEEDIRLSPFVLFLNHRFAARSLLPAISKVVLRFASVQVSVDQATLACALERYRLAEGVFPEKLDALVPKFMKSLPRDVINGEPYKYTRNQEGSFILYSVGWNTTDEGGAPRKRIQDVTTGDWVWDSAPAGANKN